MTAPYWQDEQVTLWLGDALQVLCEMPRGSVNCCVTSPPYYGLRDYGTQGQIGLEDSPAEYVERLREVFAEVRRVLADDGTLWLNIGDSYSAGGQGGNRGGHLTGGTHLDRVPGPTRVAGMAPKNLLGIPWRVAFALQDDGWTWRNVIPWHKPNAMPASVLDRLSNKWEPVLLMTKSRRYHFDLDPIREPHSEVSLARTRWNRFAADRSQVGVGSANTLNPRQTCHPDGANPGDFWEIESDPFDEWWEIMTSPYPEAHFATFPVQLPVRCIKTTRPGATVLDPFSGSGTTGEACRRLGRKYIGIDLNRAYHDLAIKRYAQGVIDFGEATA